MSGEIAGLVDQVVAAFAHVWPSVGRVAGAMAVGVVDRLRDKAADEASDTAMGWARRVVIRMFARRADGTPVTADGPLPEDTTVPAEVIETLEDLAADPDSRPARRLLAHHLTAAVVADPALVGALRELAACAPSTIVGVSGAIGQSNTGGVNVASTGVVRDIHVRGNGQ